MLPRQFAPGWLFPGKLPSMIVAAEKIASPDNSPPENCLLDNFPRTVAPQIIVPRMIAPKIISTWTIPPWAIYPKENCLSIACIITSRIIGSDGNPQKNCPDNKLHPKYFSQRIINPINLIDSCLFLLLFWGEGEGVDKLVQDWFWYQKKLYKHNETENS